MKYQKIKKEQKRYAFQIRFIAFPFIAIIAALPIFFSEGGFNAESLLWVISFGLIGIALVAYTFQTAGRLKQLRRFVGADSDAEMDAILDSAADFSGKMFVTEQYCINTKSLSFYPISAIRTLYPMTDVQRKSRNTYSVRIKYGEKGIDDVHFHNAGKRDALIQCLLDKSQGRIELVRY